MYLEWATVPGVPEANDLDPVTVNVAKLLREAKDASGLSYRDIAERTGFAKSALQNWMDGTRSPLIRDFIRLCRALDADPGNLLDRAHAESGQ